MKDFIIKKEHVQSIYNAIIDIEQLLSVAKELKQEEKSKKVLEKVEESVKMYEDMLSRSEILIIDFGIDHMDPREKNKEKARKAHIELMATISGSNGVRVISLKDHIMTLKFYSLMYEEGKQRHIQGGELVQGIKIEKEQRTIDELIDMLDL